MLIKVDRPYGGAEGKRVKVGTRFWVTGPRGGGQPPAGIQAISQGRYQQLKSMGIVTPASAEDETRKPAPRAKPEQTPARAPLTGAPAKAKVEPDSKPPGVKAASRAAAPKTKAAPESRPGSRATAEGGQQSSSLAGRPTKPSTLKQRGVRRGDKPSAGSPATTPTGSSPGATLFTPATPDGGGSTQTQQDDLALLS